MVSVIIPTLFPTESLGQYASRLARYEEVKEVVVVINNDSNKILKQVQDDTSIGIQTIMLGKNRGFTGACNAGARVATGELLLFLNDDCDMSEDVLQKMVGFMKQNADVVATQPIVMKRMANGEWRNENIGFWIDTRIGKAEPVTNIGDAQKILKQVQDDTDKKGMLRQAQHDRSIYGLSGTCLLIRKDIFEKVGMWDESFHSYLEDVDLAIRLQKTRYKVAPCLDAEVTHEHMATSSKMGLYKEKQDVINWWKLVLIHSDVFIRLTTIFPLLLERGRNISGLIKKILRRVIQ